MAAASANKQALAKQLKNNSNLGILSQLKTIDAKSTGKDLSEAQKQAIMAMMRMVHDPQERLWAKRREEYAQKFAVEKKEKNQKVKQMKKKVATMRAQATFPLPPERRGDPARRYGFIPPSQRRKQLTDYAKV